MKRIAMIHDYPPITGGGLETNTFTLSRELVRRGYPVTIATTRFESAAYSSGTINYQDGVKIQKITANASLADFIAKYDIIYVHLTFSIRPGAILAGELAVQQGKRVLATLHTSPEHIPFSSLAELTEEEKQQQLSRLLVFLNQPTVEVVIATHTLKRQLQEFGVSNGINVIHFGVEQIESIVTKEAYDILYVGRVSYLKGISYLLDGLRFLKQDGVDVSCGIIGAGAELPLFQTLSTALGLDKNVRFIGFIEDRAEIYGYMANAKLLILPSLTEVFPQVMIESQLVGTPVIASDLTGITEHFAKSGGGSRFELGNAKSLARTIRLLLEDRPKREAMGLRGQQYCTRYATITEQANQLEAFLCSVKTPVNPVVQEKGQVVQSVV